MAEIARQIGIRGREVRAASRRGLTYESVLPHALTRTYRGDHMGRVVVVLDHRRTTTGFAHNLLTTERHTGQGTTSDDTGATGRSRIRVWRERPQDPARNDSPSRRRAGDIGSGPSAPSSDVAASPVRPGIARGHDPAVADHARDRRPADHPVDIDARHRFLPASDRAGPSPRSRRPLARGRRASSRSLGP